MTAPLLPPGRLGRSIFAVFAALVAVFVLSLGVDIILHGLQVYPPWKVRMSDPLFALATSYRLVFNVFGGYLAGRLAPRQPMRHAMILAIVGIVLSGLGLAANIAKPDLGPIWYPLLLVLTTFPCAWLGGRLAERAIARRAA